MYWLYYFRYGILFLVVTFQVLEYYTIVAFVRHHLSRVNDYYLEKMSKVCICIIDEVVYKRYNIHIYNIERYIH